MKALRRERRKGGRPKETPSTPPKATQRAEVRRLTETHLQKEQS